MQAEKYESDFLVLAWGTMGGREDCVWLWLVLGLAPSLEKTFDSQAPRESMGEQAGGYFVLEAGKNGGSRNWI